MGDLNASIEGLRRERNFGVLWLVVGSILVVVDPPGLPVILFAFLLGGAAAAVRITLFSQGNLKLAGRTILIEALILFTCLFLLPESQAPKSAWGYLAVGGLTSGTTKFITGLFEGHINRKITRVFFGDTGVFAEPAKVEPSVAWRELPVMAPDPVWAKLRESVVPALRLNTSDTEYHQGEIVSKLGGTADLPADFEWPMFDSEPLSFLGQIRLDDVAAVNPSLGLPDTGLLSFFYSPKQPWGGEESDIHGGRVFFHSLEAVHPSSQRQNSGTVIVEFIEIESPNLDNATQSTVWSLERAMPETQRATYNQLLEAITPGEDHHQLMGHPVLIQNDMDDELAVAARQFALPDDTSWTLLLQLYSDSRLDWCWGDAGFIYFWLPTDDIARQRFDRAWVILQCT